MIEYRPKLVMAALKYTHNPSLAEDFADQAIGNAYVHLSKWRGENLPGWLNSILMNICRHWTRDTKREQEKAPEILKKGERTPLQHAISNEIQRAIDAALDRLTEKQREAFKLAEVDGLPFEQIAERMNVRCGAARALAFRARAALAKELERFVA